MMAVPAVIPVTIPPGVIVATPGFDDIHGAEAWGVPVPVKVIDEPTQTFVDPDIEQAGSMITSAFENMLTNSKAQTKKEVSKEL
jgi:hypothetical protein